MTFRLSDMRPSTAVNYKANRGRRNPELAGNSSLTSTRIADFQHLRLSHLGRAMSFASGARTVKQHVGHILGVRCPADMLTITAAQVAFPTIMRRFMLWCWRWPVFALADDTMNGAGFTAAPYLPVTIVAPPIRPNQAFFAVEGKDGGFQKGERVTPSGCATERIAMHAKSVVMRPAPSPSLMGLAAAINRAYSGISHVVSPYVRGQGLALLTQRLRPASYNGFPHQRKAV